RRARVDEQVDANVFLLDEESDHQPVESRVDAPVEVPEIVAGRVVAIIGEFDRGATPRAPPFALRRSRKRAPRFDSQAFESLQELGIEEPGYHIVTAAGAPSRDASLRP